jgi:DNA topoisomerase-1
MNDFYTVFHKTVDSLMNHKIENVDKTTIEIFCKNLGIDPTTGHTIYVKKGKFGPMLELGERIAFYNIKSFLFVNKKKMEDITYEDALDIMKYPKKIGDGEKGEIIIAIGKFGHYIKYDKKNYSIPKKYDLDDINIDIAKTIISAKS